MRKVTREIIAVFLAKEKATIGNSSTDGQCLYLHGNMIARHLGNGRIEITNAGRSSNTTKERLNGLPGVSIHQSKGQWYLNNEPWDGKLTTI